MTAGEIVLWVCAALLGAAVLLFALQVLMVGITFSLLYGRVQHAFSRRALFSDFPEIPVRREFVPVSRHRKLAVYQLGEKNTKGLVIVSHGIRDRAEGYFSEARGFLERGYRVLLYDATGSGASSGRSQLGLPQSAIDLQRILTWAEQNPAFAGLNFYLYGHSWGGYAVSAVFCKGAHPRVKAVASLSGFNDPGYMLFESTSTATVHFGRFMYPALLFVQVVRFGRAMYDTAEKGIRAAKNTRFLILHAEHDEAIKLNGASIYARRKALASEGERVKFKVIEGRSHLNAWFSPSACEKDAVYEARYKQLVGKFGFQLTKAQEKSFYAPIDRAERIALSEPDPAFFARIDHFYEGKDDLET